MPRRVGDPQGDGGVGGRSLGADIKRGEPVVGIRADAAVSRDRVDGPDGQPAGDGGWWRRLARGFAFGRRWPRTANITLFAIAAHADEREAHVREVEQLAASLPDGSYGRRNRQAIAARETRIATRLRAVEHACHTAIERGPGFGPPEPIRTPRFADRVVDKEIELD